MKRIDLYVLDEAMKYDKKFYGFGGLKFAKPISVRSTLYFLAPLSFMIVVNFIPILKKFLGLDFYKYGVLYIVIPIAFTYFLTDIGTEHRSPMKFLKSVILYGYRKIRGISYYRGKQLPRQKNHKFHSLMLGGFLTYREPREGDKIDG
jgi:hypothetical protein